MDFLNLAPWRCLSSSSRFLPSFLSSCRKVRYIQCWKNYLNNVFSFMIYFNFTEESKLALILFPKFLPHVLAIWILENSTNLLTSFEGFMWSLDARMPGNFPPWQSPLVGETYVSDASMPFEYFSLDLLYLVHNLRLQCRMQYHIMYSPGKDLKTQEIEFLMYKKCVKVRTDFIKDVFCPISPFWPEKL